MPKLCYHLTRLGLSTLATAAIVECLSALALAAEPLPKEIPTSSMTVAELVKQSALAVQRIEGVRERTTVLAVTLYDMRGMSREELLPLENLLSLEVAKPENEDI